MPTHFSEMVPGGSVSGTRAVERQGEGLVVEYALQSSADESVMVRLVDGLPTADLAEYGFHEEYEPADWQLIDGELDAKVTLDPESEQTYVLGLIASKGGDLAFGPAEPELQIIKAGRADTTESNDEAVADLGASQDGRADQKRVDADGGIVNPEPEPGSVASTLIAELESGAVPESKRAKLREHLVVEDSESEAVRLEYVQKRLADFDAYVDALEDLLSVHGKGNDAITGFDERLDRLEEFVDEVEAIRQRQDELAERLDDLSAGLDAQAETIESLQVTHQEDVDDVRTEIRRRAEVMCEEFNDLEQSITEDVATLEADIEAFESIRRTLVDGLHRPDDTPPGTTVEAADLDALDDPKAITNVDSSDSDEPSVGKEASSASEATYEDADDADDEPSESDDSAPAEGPMADVDLQESLETAEATNFSVSSVSEQADSNGTDADRGAELEHSDDAFVSPDSVPGIDEPDEESEPDDGADSVELAFESSSTDLDCESSRSDDTEPDDGPADGTGVNGAEEPVAGSDHEPDKGSDEVDDDADHDDEECDESPKRASSIFEIGDVDTKKSSDDEMPTIDFEDS